MALAAEHIYAYKNDTQREKDVAIQATFLEIYNEELIDLLGAESVDNPRLKIYEDATRKVPELGLIYPQFLRKTHLLFVSLGLAPRAR